MKISFNNGSLVELECDLLSVAAFEGKVTALETFGVLDKALDGLLSATATEEQFEGKEGEKLLLHTHGRISCKRILVVGLGKREDFELAESRRFAAAVAETSTACRAKRLATTLPPVDATAQSQTAQFFIEGLLLANYKFDRYLSEDKRKPSTLTAVEVWVEDEESRKAPSAICLARGQLIAGATSFARDLVNEPAGRLTPVRLAEIAQEMAKEKGLECKILGPKECEKLGMNLFLAVAQGSVHEPRLIHLTYRPKGKDVPKKRYAWVGKGVTFDSGGLSLKPSAGMLDMKGDMAGAACVLGAISALSEMGVQAEVHAIVAATENMISGSAYKLGDVLIGMNGKSVEIVNTDAEGRLTLADALSYAEKLSPDEMLNVATLTGACMVALGPHMAGVMGNDRALVERLIATARRVGEDVWGLPLPTKLREQLKTPMADMKNCGDRWGGALTAGLFLKEFVTLPWVHMDIAGPALADKADGHISKGGTGYGVSTLIEYVSSRDGAV